MQDVQLLKKSDNIPVDKLFGTILIERVIDFIFLIFFALLCVILKSSEINSSLESYNQFVKDSNSNIGVVVKLILLIVFIIAYLLKNKIKQLNFYSKIIEFIFV